VVSDIREILGLLKDATPSKVYIYVAPQWKFDVMESIRKADIPLVMKDLMKHLMSNPDFRKRGKDIQALVARITKEGGLWDHSSSAKDEFEVLSGASEYLKAEVGLEVSVQWADKPEYDPAGRAKNALPGKVSLYIE